MKWSRAEIQNMFMWGNNQNELVSDRREPAAAGCSTMVHSTNSS